MRGSTALVNISNELLTLKKFRNISFQMILERTVMIGFTFHMQLKLILVSMNLKG